MLVYLRDGSAHTIARAEIEAEAVDQTFYLTQSHYTDAGQTSPGRWPYNASHLAG